jgi:hypothetical protein
LATAQTQKIALPKRINPVAQYLMALAAIICLYSCYEKFAVPWFEGPQRTITKVESDLDDDTVPLHQDKSRIINLLGEGSDYWELQPCSTLKLDEGIILFQKRKNCPDGSVEFSPFTFVSGEEPVRDGGDNTSAKRPFIVRSTEGANIKFNQPFNGMNLDGIKPVLCRLQGEVEIYSLSDEANGESLIYIATRNVTIDAHRITTPEAVEFKFGESLGIGSDLSIELAHPSTALADFSNITGINSLQLTKIEKIYLEPESGKTATPSSAFQTTSASTPQSKNKIEREDGPIEVTCSGPFKFDFETGQAEFFDSVTANQPVQQNKIECDHLVLIFGSPSNTQSTPLKIAHAKTKISELSRLVANGAPATITTPSASIKANILTFDPETNLFSGQKNQTPDGLPVQIKSAEMQLEAELLNYQAKQDGSLGDLQIVGPGWIKFAGKTNQDAIVASWKNNLRTVQNPQSIDIFDLVLSGQSVISTDAQTSISADQINLQIRKTYDQRLTNPNLTTPTVASAKPNYVPLQLTTKGTTNLRSPEIEGQTEELIAIWLKAPIVGKRMITPTPPNQFRQQNSGQLGYIQPTISTPNSASNQSNRRLPTTPRGLAQSARPRNLLSASTTDNRNTQTSQTALLKPRPDLNPRLTDSPKLEFSGQRLTILLTNNQSQTEVKKMLIQGRVTIKRGTKSFDANGAVAQKQNLPFEIKNSSEVELEKIDNSEFHLLTIVSDRPEGAELSSAEFSISGKRIEVNEKLDKIVIHGKGTLNLNPKKQAQVTPIKFSKAGIPPLQQDSTQLNVQWDDGMIFDGSTIYFQQEVHAKTQQQSPDGAIATLETHSDAMSVELRQRFSFRNSKNASPEIREFKFKNHIPNLDRAFQNNRRLLPDPVHPEPVRILRQNFNAKREQIQRVQAQMALATVNVESGKTQLVGPGKIAIHRLNADNSGLPSLSFDQQQTPNLGALSFIQIDFEREMEIDSEGDRLIADGGAHVFYDITSNWNIPNQANRNPGSVTLQCETLAIDKWGPRNQEDQSVELLASGNVSFESDALDITADRITYNGGAEMITIKGNSRSDANLIHRKFLGDLNPDRLNARSFNYFVKDKSLKADGMRQLNIN